MRTILILVPLLLLCGCKSEAEKRVEWIAMCEQGEFSTKQCAVLYSIVKASNDAKDSADYAGVMSSVGMGLAAVASTGR